MKLFSSKFYKIVAIVSIVSFCIGCLIAIVAFLPPLNPPQCEDGRVEDCIIGPNIGAGLVFFAGVLIAGFSLIAIACSLLFSQIDFRLKQRKSLAKVVLITAIFASIWIFALAAIRVDDRNLQDLEPTIEDVEVIESGES